MPASNGDSLHTPDQVCLPEDRNLAFGIHDISVQYDLINQYQLEGCVPEVIATQYEVARNLYLYTFHVYRFYMVAQHQALVVLEMAIKERFGSDEKKKYARSIKKSRGLYVCLRYLLEGGYIENSDFPSWRRRPRVQAEYQLSISKIQEMKAKGLKGIEVDYSVAEVTSEPEDFNYLDTLLDGMPKISNTHAHGSQMLHSQILVTFEDVSIIINKLFKPER